MPKTADFYVYACQVCGKQQKIDTMLKGMAEMCCGQRPKQIRIDRNVLLPQTSKRR